MSGTGLAQTTNTFAFNPSLGETTLWAFSRCGVRRTAVTQEHFADARTTANMILSDWANEQPNLWTVELISLPLVQNQATYNVPANVILMLDAYIQINNGALPIDLYMYPISRTEWAAFPDKITAGRPTVYWFDRLIAPTVTLWQPPSDASWTFYYYAVRQMQDAGLANGGTVEVPYYFLKAFGDRLAAELAVMYAPERAEALMALADKSWEKAAKRNAEDVPLFITPGMQGYYRS